MDFFLIQRYIYVNIYIYEKLNHTDEHGVKIHLKVSSRVNNYNISSIISKRNVSNNSNIQIFYKASILIIVT